MRAQVERGTGWPQPHHAQKQENPRSGWPIPHPGGPLFLGDPEAWAGEARGFPRREEEPLRMRERVPQAGLVSTQVPAHWAKCSAGRRTQLSPSTP